MSESDAPKPARAGLSAWLVLAGLVFILVWMALAVALGVLMVMPALMVNDSGHLSSGRHLGVMAGMYGGLALLALAGLPAGLAIFWRGSRGLLLWIFGGLLAAGLLVEFITFYSLS